MEDESSKPTHAQSREREGKGNPSFQAQGELFKTLQEIGRDWMACATAEAELGFKLSKNLSVARSVPDAIAAYGEWMSDSAHTENARRLMSNGQRLLDTSSRILSNGWMTPGAST